MKIKGFRWWIIGLIFIATVINYIDRSALALMWGKAGEAGSMSDSLGLGEGHYALISNVFLIAYAFGQLFSGKVFDKVGTRIGYVLSIGIWGLSSFLHSFARGAISIGILRTTLGISEAGNWPGAVKSNAEWFPIKERAIAQGLFNAGASMGSVIAPLFIGYLWAAYGWQTTFMVIGSFGLLWIIPWLIINKSGPKTHPWITEKERQYILDGQSKADQSSTSESKGLSLGQILSYKESWSVILGRFFMEPIWWFFVIWMPLYLSKEFDLDVKGVAMFAWVPYVGAAIGSILGGFVSGKLIAKSGSINRGRKVTITIGGVIMFLGLLVTLLMPKSNPTNFVLVICVVLFGFQFAISNIQTLPSDFFSGKSVGSLAGLGGMIGIGSVIILNFIIPMIAKVSYTPIFIIIATFVPLGIGAIYFFARKIQPVEEVED
jgi:ACS family hexuronate transporter-like MFS transporter